MWLFIKDNTILATVGEEKFAKDIAVKMKGYGLRTCHVEDILPIEDVWDME